jgi:hypothetical protein
MSQVFIKTQNNSKQGKQRRFLLSGLGPSAQPYLKQPYLFTF